MQEYKDLYFKIEKMNNNYYIQKSKFPNKHRQKNANHAVNNSAEIYPVVKDFNDFINK